MAESGGGDTDPGADAGSGAGGTTPTGGVSTVNGPRIVTPSGEEVGTAAPPKKGTSTDGDAESGSEQDDADDVDTTGGVSTPQGPRVVKPSGKQVGTAVSPGQRGADGDAVSQQPEQQPVDDAAAAAAAQNDESAQVTGLTGFAAQADEAAGAGLQQLPGDTARRLAASNPGVRVLGPAGSGDVLVAGPQISEQAATTLQTGLENRDQDRTFVDKQGRRFKVSKKPQVLPVQDAVNAAAVGAAENTGPEDAGFSSVSEFKRERTEQLETVLQQARQSEKGTFTIGGESVPREQFINRIEQRLARVQGFPEQAFKEFVIGDVARTIKEAGGPGTQVLGATIGTPTNVLTESPVEQQFKSAASDILSPVIGRSAAEGTAETLESIASSAALSASSVGTAAAALPGTGSVIRSLPGDQPTQAEARQQLRATGQELFQEVGETGRGIRRALPFEEVAASSLKGRDELTALEQVNRAVTGSPNLGRTFESAAESLVTDVQLVGGGLPTFIGAVGSQSVGATASQLASGAVTQARGLAQGSEFAGEIVEETSTAPFGGAVLSTAAVQKAADPGITLPRNTVNRAVVELEPGSTGEFIRAAVEERGQGVREAVPRVETFERGTGTTAITELQRDPVSDFLISRGLAPESTVARSEAFDVREAEGPSPPAGTVVIEQTGTETVSPLQFVRTQVNEIQRGLEGKVFAGPAGAVRTALPDVDTGTETRIEPRSVRESTQDVRPGLDFAAKVVADQSLQPQQVRRRGQRPDVSPRIEPLPDTRRGTGAETDAAVAVAVQQGQGQSQDIFSFTAESNVAENEPQPNNNRGAEDEFDPAGFELQPVEEQQQGADKPGRERFELDAISANLAEFEPGTDQAATPTGSFGRALAQQREETTGPFGFLPSAEELKGKVDTEVNFL